MGADWLNLVGIEVIFHTLNSVERNRNCSVCQIKLSFFPTILEDTFPVTIKEKP